MSDIYDQLADEMHQLRNARPELFITIYKTEQVPFTELMGFAINKAAISLTLFADRVAMDMAKVRDALVAEVGGENYATTNTQ